MAFPDWASWVWNTYHIDPMTLTDYGHPSIHETGIQYDAAKAQYDAANPATLDDAINTYNQEVAQAATAYAGTVTYTPEGQPVDANGTYTPPPANGAFDGTNIGATQISPQDLARW